MQPPPLPRPTQDGKIISIARVYVKAGQGSRMKKLIAAIAHEANKEEAGTLTYRPVQALGEENMFLIFEEYTSQGALETHYKGRAFSAMGEALGKEDILDIARGGVVIDYYEAF